MSEVSFRPKARTMILLGEELIKDDLTAITELVKNSYDADATHIIIEVSNEESFIRLWDNGHGMTSTIISTRWMEPATNFKAMRKNGIKMRSPIFGRVYLGEKGVGRFSCHRLAQKLVLTSRGTDQFIEEKVTINEEEKRVVQKVPSGEESKLIVDWNLFESDSYLSDVKIPFDIGKPNIFLNNTGTELLMQELKEFWDEDKTNALKIILIRLIHPFGEKPELKIDFIVDNQPVQLDFSVFEYINRSDIKIKGNVDTKGNFTGSLNGEKITESLPVYERDFRNKEASCGDFNIEFSVFERNDLASLRKNYPQIDNISSQYGGVAIYRDGFRVLPYGEKGVDWLNLDERRISRVSERIGNKQIQGLISISTDNNSKLTDKTNREGLIENQAYYDFKELVFRVIKFIENQRIKKTVKKNKAITNTEFINRISSIEKVINEEVPILFKQDIVDDLKKVKDAYINEKKQVQNRMENLSQLSGIGIAAERTTHEIGHLVNKLKATIQELRKLVLNSDEGLNLVETMLNYTSALDSELKLLNPLFKANRLMRTQLDIKKVINKTTLFFKNAFQEHHIDFSLTEDSPLEVFENEGVIIQCLINLFDNAVYWCVQKAENEHFIKVLINGTKKTITISDSGPGVSQKDAPYIFEPLYSKRKDGRGMGLFITEDVLNSRGHEIRLLEVDQVTGASFQIKFNSKGENDD
ncbi:sensor histidine kinase [Paenibacillus agri]|uniref:histidine kinase n=1 Tax=Paenibacillus agri TaxID=2744309 RepID=A0A850ENI2_9BACL|nr:sensor histidine kinase [Paenibacillus agri]NUU61097.1 sensor histidine kinase [Paenibacillus agri]